MNVIFYNRDYSQRISPISGVTVDRYSWNMIGGPQTAYLTALPGPDGRELTKLLRCPVEIYGADGRLNWWGYVNKVTFPHGRQSVGLGLDELYNYIIVAYADGDTAAASDANSITEYGQKETRLSNVNATQTEAEQSRDLYLAAHKYAPTELEFSGGANEVRLECYGWYNTLGWKYYTDADITNTANETQIANIVTSAGQFLAGSVIESATGLTSNENRDGHSTALTYINQLLAAGTSNTRPLLAYVDSKRYLHVYERAAETTQYLLTDDGRLEDLLGAEVPGAHCKSAVWVRLKDLTNTLGGFSAIPAFFVESAEYNAKDDRTTYRPAGSYEQVRLARYVETVVSGESGSSGNYTGGYISPYPYVPTTPAPSLRIHKYCGGPSLSGVTYLDFDDAVTATLDVSYGSALIVTMTSDGGNPVWQILKDGEYSIIINLSSSGSLVSDSAIGMIVARGRSSTYSAVGHIDHPLPASSNLITWSFTMMLPCLAGDYIRVSLQENTNSFAVDYGEMIMTLEREK